ncbi:uncharacterized protein K441DRAFT_589500, partial [Cenococcum geophilum 1.58]
YKYSRFTLEEILYIYLRLQEHTKLVQIFNAIKYISTAGLLYGSVTLNAVRICGRSRRVLLSSLTSNLDLEQLGYIVLKYINGRPWKDLRKVDFIR